jgi:predicted lipoprotein with Yx(FWY)xxD motif
MSRIRVAALTATAALGIVLMSACGSAPLKSHPSQAQPPAPPAAPAGQAGQGQVGGTADAVRLAATKLANLGTVVTDGNGMTLYRFDRDKAKPSVSNCYGDCEKKWPPMLATSDDFQVTGIDQALIGTVTRKDGSKQITIAGWPAYHYAKDAAPGEAKGEGIGKTWYALTPQGKKAMPAQQQPPADPGGYGY